MAIQSAATIATLRSLVASTYPNVFVAGYYGEGDGGGGNFWYNAADTTSPDNGGTIIVTTQGSRYYRVLDGDWLSVLKFGADPTGSRDSLQAFSGALSALPNIFIPNGLFKFSGSLSYTVPTGLNSVTITGSGQDNTILYWPNGGGLTINYGVFTDNTQNASAHIRDLTLTTGTSGSGSAITLSYPAATNPNSSTSDVTRVTVRGQDGYAQSFYWSIGVNIYNVSNVNMDSVSVYGSASISGNGVVIAGRANAYSVVYNIQSSTMNYLATGIYYGSWVQGVTVNQTNITACFYGVYSGSGETGLDQLQIVNSQINPVANGYGVLMQSQVGALVVSDSLFILNSNCTAINVGAAGITISGNNITGVVASSYGVVISSGGLGIITGNTLNNLNTGVFLQTNSSNINVQSNNYQGCTSNTANQGSSNRIGGGSA